MTIHAIFFDLDDTLCQTTATRLDRARLSAEALLPHAPGLDLETLMARMLALNDQGFPVGTAPIVQELGLAGTEAAERARGIWFFQGCEHLISCYEGAETAVDALYLDYTLGVISNGHPDIQKNKLGFLSFGHRFHAELTVFSEAIGHSKPDPAIFQHALQRARVEPRDAIMVGDWALGDVGGAQAAGMRGVWFNPEGRSLPNGVTPDATIRRFSELPSLLRAWST